MLARGSYSWIAAAIISTAALGYLSMKDSGLLYILFKFLFVIGAILTVFFFIFFRDPDRKPMGDEDDMVSPADGKVISIKDNTICIFMNIHNVHVNRAPLAGTVIEIDYKPGGYIPACNKGWDSWHRRWSARYS